MKLGDKVSIISYEMYLTLVENKIIENFDFVDTMTEYCGKTATITKVMEKVDNSAIYRLDIDHGYWVWSDYMFSDNGFVQILEKLNKFCKKECNMECGKDCNLFKYKHKE